MGESAWCFHSIQQLDKRRFANFAHFMIFHNVVSDENRAFSAVAVRLQGSITPFDHHRRHWFEGFRHAVRQTQIRFVVD